MFSARGVGGQVGQAMGRFRQLPDDALLILAVTTFESVGMGFVFLVLVLFLEDAGFTNVKIGVTLAAFTAADIAMQIPAARLAGRIGLRLPIVMGILVATLGWGLYLLEPDFRAYLLASAVAGAGTGLFSPSMRALLARSVDEERRKFIFSLQAVGTTVGFTIGSFLGGFLTAERSLQAYQTVLVFAVLAFFARLPLTLPILWAEERLPARPPPPPRGAGWADRRIRWFAFTAALLGLGAGLAIPWFQLYFRNVFGASNEQIGALFGLGSLLMAGSFLLVPFFAARMGSVRTVVLTQAVATAVLFAMPFSPTFLVVSALYIVRTVMMNVNSPIGESFMLSLVAEADRPFASSVTYVAFSAPYLASQAAFGFLPSLGAFPSFAVGIFLCAAFYGLSTTLYRFAFLSHDDRRAKRAATAPRSARP